jgi:replicative DNA helicase
MSEKTPRWKSQKEGFLEALRYMKGRQEGTITSFKTPWRRMNDATTDGLEWGTITVIGGRPGTGKTLVKDQIIREGVKLNCSLDEYEQGRYPFRVLEFQFEMMARTSSMREFSSVLGKSYKYVCSADGRITDEEIDKCYEYSKKRVAYPIDVVEEPCTVTQFRSTVIDYMKNHSTKSEDGRVTYMNTIVTLDHSMLLKKSTAERDKFETLYSFGETITELKRKYPICFIILSQLNRNVDDPKRNEEGKFGNYVLDSDIFGADALLQHADTLIGLNRPGKNKIRIYGPDKYIIDDDNIIAMHFLKCRNGDTRISFFRAEFQKMRLVEIAPPPKQESRLKT